MLAAYAALLDKVRASRPLIHHITNYVTVNDCANITLGIGASPIMADDVDEAADIAALAQALVINTGTLSNRVIPSMFAAGKAANAKGIPVILDPVGAGASRLRNETLGRILGELALSVIRGNISEIRFLAGLCADARGVDTQGAGARGVGAQGADTQGAGARGVDASDEDAAFADKAGQTAKELAQKLNCVVVISGARDTVSDGSKIVYIENGHPMLSRLTGTGCMCSSLIAAFCASAPGECFPAAAAAMLCMGIAGELAFEKAGQFGIGSFHMALHDLVSTMDAQTLVRMGRYHEA